MEYKDICSEWTTPKTIAELDMRLDNYKILFAYNSAKIENPEINYYDTREIFENGKVINYTGDLRNLFEIKNQKVCYDFLRQKIVDREPVTTGLVKQIHKLLMANCYDEHRYEIGERPGEFKKHEYEVGVFGVGLPSEDIEPEMNYMCDQLAQNEGKIHPLKAASWFHCNFENIHPFADGNGRTGRTIMDYYLMTHDHPPAIIYEENKMDYYAALTIFDKTEEIEPFESFIKTQTEKTWSKSPGVKKWRGLGEFIPGNGSVPRNRRPGAPLPKPEEDSKK